MTEWITTLYNRYVELFGDPSPDEATVSPTRPAATPLGKPPAS